MTVNTSALAYRESAPADAHGAANPRTVVPRVQTSNTNAGALDPTCDVIFLNSAGAETRTLAAGVLGQRITLYALSASGAIGITLTGNPTPTDLLTMDAAADRVELLYTGSTNGWQQLYSTAVTFS